jgi:hypothetical protein
MELLRVPRREVAVRILLDDGRTLDGSLFTAATGHDGRPERVLDHLNDSSEEFFPVACGEDRFVLNKAGVISVTIAGGEEEIGEPELYVEPEHEVPVRMTLTGGISLIGKLPIAMPRERSRVVDYLNSAPRFVPLLGSGQVTLVQRGYIVSVRGEERRTT